MSIDYSTTLGYGVVIPEKEANKIINFIQTRFSNEEADEFVDTYLRCINSWTGGDHFLGFIFDLGSESVIHIDKMYYEFNALDFDLLLYDWDLINVIDWSNYDLHTCIINFCY